jgi:hypothetical protein
LHYLGESLAGDFQAMADDGASTRIWLKRCSVNTDYVITAVLRATQPRDVRQLQEKQKRMRKRGVRN